MRKAKAQADASELTSNATMEAATEPSATPKKRVVRRKATADEAAPAVVAEPVDAAPAPKARAARKKAEPEVAVTEVHTPLAHAPKAAPRTRKAASVAKEASDIAELKADTNAEATPVSKRPAVARPRRKAAADNGVEQLALELPDQTPHLARASTTGEAAATVPPALARRTRKVDSGDTTPDPVARATPKPATSAPSAVEVAQERRSRPKPAPEFAPPLATHTDPAPAPSPSPLPAGQESRAERATSPNYVGSESTHSSAGAAPRPRKLDPEEEIAEAIAEARKAQAEAKALHAEARAKAAEAKAREAEARMRAAEARVRATGGDPFSDMDGESVIVKAPPLPNAPRQGGQGHDQRRDGGHNQPRHNNGGQNYNQPQGQSHGQGGQGQGGQGRPNQPGGRPETVFQGHGGKPNKRDKFAWKKERQGRGNKPWQQRGDQPQQGGSAPAQGGAGDQQGETWSPRGEQADSRSEQDPQQQGGGRPQRPAPGGGQQDGAPRGERQERGDRPERPERPPMEDRPVRDPEYGEGIIEISGKGKGFGFLREAVRNYNQSPSDVFVTPEIIRKYNLKDGQKIYGETRRGNRGPQLYKLIHINGENPEKYRKAPSFDELTAINPMERLKLETTPDRYTTRVIDMMTPIGKGQRGLIVSPPRSGKTTMMQQIAEAVLENYPDMPLILMLIDERPEEVTELRRALPKAEVIASSNDSDPRAHLRTAQLGIERAKRLVEGGRDVFMLLDSITRMGRAFNNAMHPGGKTGSGGIDSKAMEIPRKIFAAARNTEEAGSLTIIATALVDTGSKGDEYIFQEFKGTGNMEIVLDRKISDQLIFPAIDIFQSGTRREELILPPFMLDKINTIRRGLAGTKNIDAISRLLMFLRRFPTNFELLSEIPG